MRTGAGRVKQEGRIGLLSSLHLISNFNGDDVDDNGYHDDDEHGYSDDDDGRWRDTQEGRFSSLCEGRF